MQLFFQVSLKEAPVLEAKTATSFMCTITLTMHSATWTGTCHQATKNLSVNTEETGHRIGLDDTESGAGIVKDPIVGATQEPGTGSERSRTKEIERDQGTEEKGKDPMTEMTTKNEKDMTEGGRARTRVLEVTSNTRGTGHGREAQSMIHSHIATEKVTQKVMERYKDMIGILLVYVY